MKISNVSTNASSRRILPMACATALAVAFTTVLALPADARNEVITPPAVPGNIQVPAGNTPFLLGHGDGTQNYICLPAGAGFKFQLFTPRATLFNGGEKQITTHYFSPNPSERNTIRATWEHSRDSSLVWAEVVQGDNATVDPTAVDWLKLTVRGVAEGPTGGDTLTYTTFIQRVNTVGGLAPSTGCKSLADVGAKAFVHYTADYIFYTQQ